MLNNLADFFLPRICLACGRNLSAGEEHLCLPCRVDMPFTYFEKTVHNPMADRYNAKIAAGIDAFEPYQQAAALIRYSPEGGYDNIPQHLKYLRDFKAGKYFAKMLGERLKASGLYDDVDMVIPVPLHWTRRMKRGYNQAEIIAKAVAAELGAKMRADILVRTRRTKTQTRLSAARKGLNVKGAFGVRKKRLPGEQPLHILIIDDVFTSGATLCACHDALRTAFGQATKISVATLSYAGQ